MWELDHKESWVLKNWCFPTMVLEKTCDPLDSKEIKPVNPEGNQPWIFIRKTCWSWNSNTSATLCKEFTHLKKPWCWETLRARGEGARRRMSWLNGITDSMDICFNKLREIVKDRKAWHAGCCSSWDCKESDMTELLNNRCSVNFLIRLFVWYWIVWAV